MSKEEDIDNYGGSAREAGWYERPGRVVAIFAGNRCLWQSEDSNDPVQLFEDIYDTNATKDARYFGD